MHVYKYRGNFERDLKSLQDDQFWASSIDQLNDPCEGLLITDEIEQQLQDFGKLMQSQRMLQFAITKLVIQFININYRRSETGR